ncbi:MAG: Hypothetical protein i Rubrerythrin cluster [uncultured Thiotrichaceae bacterium]|uniref:DUF3501 domain-containing protein n=1 Tax=uncultured Thiotrichaceae bacterium TaxID=298394 RepID=A0A6S6TDB1_9GAMM|nr:MAG: Hypothetical protein i Rubrerythrin cluster [uncultured Thiotrichaceae bacterium]
MNKLTRDDLYSLEEYSAKRNAFRAEVMEHKKNRRLAIGENASLYFEDRVVMQYQIQEILRAEKIFEADEIAEELKVYNAMIPDGSNWKVTFMLEYADVEQRKVALSQLLGIDQKTWVRVDGFDKVYPISNEDLERETEDKTSSVHFMRFELTSEMVVAAKEGAVLSAGIEHENYHHTLDMPENIRASLVSDLA